MARLLESGVKLTQCVLDGHRGCQFVVAETLAEDAGSPMGELAALDS